MKESGLPPTQLKRLRAQAVDTILRQALALKGSLHQHQREVLEFGPSENPDWEETLQSDPARWQQTLDDPSLWSADALVSRVKRPQQQPTTLIVDTSLSMSGEKLAMLAVAVAALVLEWGESPFGLVAFEHRATVLARPGQKPNLRELIGRLMDVPARGYTHLERGLEEGLRLHQSLEARSRALRSRPPIALLISDGKPTAGDDPSKIAPHFSNLSVIKLGRDRGSLDLCHSMSRLGGGYLFEVPSLRVLPRALLEFSRSH
jgi:Mg-chelatase subunit ChlD